MKKPSASRLLCFCLCALLCVPFAATAAEPSNVTLPTTSPKAETLSHDDAILLAREVLKEKYGHTDKTLVEFAPVAMRTQSADGANLWAVLFEPQMRSEQLGRYRVDLSSATGEVNAVTWTWDSADNKAALAEGLHSQVWGAAHLEMLDALQWQYMLTRAEMVLEKGDYRAWPVEDKAALAQIYVNAGVFQELESVPKEGDVPQADALRIAREAVMAAYGVSSEALDPYAVYTSFFLLGEESLWVFEFEPAEHAPELGQYTIEVRSPSGEVAYCKWYEGVVSGGETIPEQTPGKSDIPREDAIRIAREAVVATYAEKYHITEEMLSGFSAYAWFDRDDPQNPVWRISLQFPDSVVSEMLGSYNIVLSAQTGEVLEISRSENG